jgi:Flp pilus assembly protein TadD
LILGFLIIFSTTRPGLGVNRLVLAIVPIGLLIFLVCAIAIPLFKYHDRGVNRAIAQARAGDAEGAILELRRQIEDRGPSGARSNALGCLLVSSKRWDEANRMFDEAERLGMDRALVLSNRGMAFLEMGDPEAALPLFEEAVRGRPDQIAFRCNLCRALGALGRIDEARTQLTLAEDIRKRTLVLAGRRAMSETIQECRDRLATLKPTDLRALDEF